MKRHPAIGLLILVFTGLFICFQETAPAKSSERPAPATRKALAENPNQVLEWNQIFIDTLVATNTANSSSQRLGAIVHTAIFDAYNGIERRYTPIFVHDAAPNGASRRAAVIAAAYTALVGLFPSRKPALDAAYVASLASLGDDDGDGGRSLQRGIAWGDRGRATVLVWRATDGFNSAHLRSLVGQRRPVASNTALVSPMSGQGLAFTTMFVLDSNFQFRPGPPRSSNSATTLTISTQLRRLVGRRIDAHSRPNGARYVLGG